MLWHDNDHVRIWAAVGVLIFSTGTYAQSTPPSCPAERPIDDIITEVHKEQSKKAHNPFPEVTCIWGWCRDTPRLRQRPTVPEPAPTAETATGDNRNASDISSSKIAVDRCNHAMEMALEAAHNVDVGDYSFTKKNYRGALLRYKDAVEEKPEDVAVLVRLGRALEKLGQFPEAIKQYNAAQKLTGPKKWIDEANAALRRLQQPPQHNE
jgi:tetratricopeptide (TPR) repeat protein